jgi:glyoxylase-like metal-dependent hydrolase (beta-lactamase superfamily II)
MLAKLLPVFFLPMLLAAQTKDVPEWCHALPRPEYKPLQRMLESEPWFEVYKVSPGVFAIYEPHQFEEVISYLIVGTKQALLFDTGMGIGEIKGVVSRITSRPVVVLNSHTHNDHVGGNWQFSFVYGTDTSFTRANAKGSIEDAQAELGPDSICGNLPKNFDAKNYRTKPWHVSLFVHDGFKINLGGRTLEILSTPGHTPDSISLIDRAKLVLGAHNIPVAQPSVLPELLAAIQAVREGQGTVKPGGDGKEVHSLNGFSFLFAAAKK